MKERVVVAVAALMAMGTGNAVAEDKLPNLLGKWTGIQEYALILKTEAPTLPMHAVKDEFGQFSIDYEFTQQEGRLLKGVKTSASKTEKIVCAIGYDKDDLHCTDENGHLDGEIEHDGQEIIGHYHHVTSDNSVVATVKLTRVK